VFFCDYCFHSAASHFLAASLLTGVTLVIL
jgi:hypothetical protein